MAKEKRPTQPSEIPQPGKYPEIQPTTSPDFEPEEPGIPEEEPEIMPEGEPEPSNPEIPLPPK
ncbi:MAG TPA: hypothetical protein VGD17_09345 [Chitinophagaceae bacterium]